MGFGDRSEGSQAIDVLEAVDLQRTRREGDGRWSCQGRSVQLDGQVVGPLQRHGFGAGGHRPCGGLACRRGQGDLRTAAVRELEGHFLGVVAEFPDHLVHRPLLHHCGDAVRLECRDDPRNVWVTACVFDQMVVQLDGSAGPDVEDSRGGRVMNHHGAGQTGHCPDGRG